MAVRAGMRGLLTWTKRVAGDDLHFDPATQLGSSYPFFGA
jgi:hypothetical protein